ncbi:ABC transporter ATP-binding protein [Butyrivibrio sp. MC2013]|uniref:ABC transporter ATP-binding protein n=1 Tax=Butyrivibrio sp. MC2013 TaxID=1280686 RepID=UPI0003FCC5C6|nr:ABC transporter ATP-binding protein [Butyrivibrio sp. MC2013]
MKKNVRKIIRFDNSNKLIFFILLLLSVIQSAAIPFVMVDFIDVIGEAKSMKELLYLVSVYFFLMIFGMILDVVFEYYASLEEFKYSQRLRYEVQNELFRKNGDYFEDEKAGDLLYIVSDDTAKIASFIYKSYGAIMSFLQAIAILVVLVYYDFKLATILIIMIPVTILIQKNFENRLHEAAIENRNDYGDTNALTEEFVSNAVEMIASGYKKYFLEKYINQSKRLLESFRRLTIANIMSNQLLQLVTMMFFALITCIGGYHVYTSKISIGVLIVFFQYCPKFIGPFENIVLLRVSYNMIRPSMERIAYIFENDCEGKGNIGHIDEILFKNVDFQYASGKTVITNFNYCFKHNKKYLICGQSGSGKSTIFNLVMGLRSPNKGTIIINGNDLTGLNKELYRSKIAIVSQKSFLFHDTIFNNLVSNYNVSEDRVMSVLRQVGLYEMVSGLQDGLNTVLGDDGKNISGGQRQRLAIARALLKPSDVIIFDEPTSALDKENEELISNTIKGIENKIVIIISHSECFADCVDETLCIGN